MTLGKRLRATKKRKLKEGTCEKRTPPVKGRTLPHQSWANHYGIKHLADELPLRERAAFNCKELNKIQKAGRGPFHGQPMTRLPMSKSLWPNKKYLHDLRIPPNLLQQPWLPPPMTNMRRTKPRSLPLQWDPLALVGHYHYPETPILTWVCSFQKVGGQTEVEEL
ncbi:hypothetical protein C8J57DRAFT_1246572 [Mycena rebaudengoi]|nr:hypothetical protein C8J57DRAFT_1246572 [Mycena rebaudengoi]